MNQAVSTQKLADFHTDSDQLLLRDVYQFYSSKLIDELAVVDYIYDRGFSDNSIENFQMGYTNRLLHQLLIDSPSLKQDRGKLKRLGLIKTETGHELFNGCITIPVMSNGRILGGYGRRARPDIRMNAVIRPFHLLDDSALFNQDCLLDKPETILLTKSPIEAISLMQMGFDFVIGLIGEHELLPAHIAKLAGSGVKTVKVLLDASNDYEQSKLLAIASMLNQSGIECLCANLANYIDVNHLLARFSNGSKIANQVIKQAKVVTGNDF